MENNNTNFLGKGWSFPPEFSSHNQSLEMVDGVQDVNESLWILLSTAPGERVMNPEYGCRLKSIVFESVNSNTVKDAQRTIEQAILLHESRITLETVNVDATGIVEGVLNFELIYTIRTTNTRHNLVYPYYILEGTNVSL
jgi:phage baseplate assembly protein W